MVDNNKRVSLTGLSLISPDLRTSPPVSTCTSVPGEDERLDAAFAGPRFLLPKAGVDLTPLAQISSRSRGVAGRAVACQVSPSVHTVVAGLALRL
jgi:hypothetical protein